MCEKKREGFSTTWCSAHVYENDAKNQTNKKGMCITEEKHMGKVCMFIQSKEVKKKRTTE